MAAAAAMCMMCRVPHIAGRLPLLWSAQAATWTVRCCEFHAAWLALTVRLGGIRLMRSFIWGSPPDRRDIPFFIFIFLFYCCLFGTIAHATTNSPVAAHWALTVRYEGCAASRREMDGGGRNSTRGILLEGSMIAAGQPAGQAGSQRERAQFEGEASSWAGTYAHFGPEPRTCHWFLPGGGRRGCEGGWNGEVHSRIVTHAERSRFAW